MSKNLPELTSRELKEFIEEFRKEMRSPDDTEVKEGMRFLKNKVYNQRTKIVHILTIKKKWTGHLMGMAMREIPEEDYKLIMGGNND